MTSEVKFNYIFNYWWEELKWSGYFNVDWIIVKDLHHDDVKDIKMNDISVVQLRDGSFLDYNVGMQILKSFLNSPYVSDIFEAFEFMDSREEKLRMKRDSFYNYILQLKKKGFLPQFKARTYKNHNKKRYSNSKFSSKRSYPE